MSNHCQQFKTSREALLDMDSVCLNFVLHRLVPDDQFRFITFLQGDYRCGNLTMLVYNYIPDKVIICVESAASLKRAMDELSFLNPGVEWDFGAVNYFDACNGSDYCIAAELRLITVPLRVNAQGILLGK